MAAILDSVLNKCPLHFLFLPCALPVFLSLWRSHTELRRFLSCVSLTAGHLHRVAQWKAGSLLGCGAACSGYALLSMHSFPSSLLCTLLCCLLGQTLSWPSFGFVPRRTDELPGGNQRAKDSAFCFLQPTIFLHHRERHSFLSYILSILWAFHGPF